MITYTQFNFKYKLKKIIKLGDLKYKFNNNFYKVIVDCFFNPIQIIACPIN